MKFLKNTILLSIILAGFFAGLQQIPVINDPIVRKKIRALNWQADSINTIFLGTSLTYRSFLPPLFDSLMSGKNQQITSFNMGIPGMQMLETQYMLEEILQRNLPQLKYLILEVPNFKPVPAAENWLAWRITKYHDVKRTTIACSAILQSSFSFTEKAEMIKTCLNHFSMNMTSAGELRQFYRTFSRDPGAALPLKLHGYKGYKSLEAEIGTEYRKRRQYFISQEGQQEYRALLKKATLNDGKRKNQSFEFRLTTIEIIIDMIRQCESRGIKLIFLKPPVQGKQSAVDPLLETHFANIPLVDLNLPNKYPALFAVENMFDLAHLKREGAIVATKRLAALLNKEGIFPGKPPSKLPE